MGSGSRFGLRRLGKERTRWSMMPSHSDMSGRGGFTLTEHTLTREQYLANEAAIDAQAAEQAAEEDADVEGVEL